MKLTIEWQDDKQTHRKTIQMNRIIDLGRSPSCQIGFDDKTVSRRHAIIYPYNKGIYLQNLSSTNRIWVDKAIPLHKGDSILLQEGVSFNIGRIHVLITAVQTNSAQQTMNSKWNFLQKSATNTPAPIFSLV